MQSRFIILPILLFLLLFFSHYCHAEQKGYPVFDNFNLPESLDLCGEPVPLANSRVREMLEREFIILVCDRAQIILWLKRAGRYFPFIEKMILEANMPEDLKYLAVAESSLLTYTQSEAGAVGPWQFMKNTARQNNLYNDNVRDERLNFENSTAAALKYLQKLKDTLGTWALAMAAYNCGETRVKNVIKEQKVNDYYRLDLPIETERYIYRISAIKIIMQEPRRYGYDLPAECSYRPMEFDSISVDLRSPLHILNLAQALGTDFKTIRELNPQMLSWYLPAGHYVLNVPLGMGEKSQEIIRQSSAAKARAAQPITGPVYVVQSGDTLGHIAKKTGVPAETLKQLNNIEGALIRPGQKLRLSP